MTNYKILDLEFGSGADPFSVSNILGVKSSVVAEYYVGHAAANGDLIDISGNSRGLTAYGSPVPLESAVTDYENNRLKYVQCNGVTTYYKRDHEPWMDMFSSDFTLCFVIHSPASLGSNSLYFGHAVYGASGIMVAQDTNGYLTATLWKAGGANVVTTRSQNLFSKFHIIHVVRSGTSFTIYVTGSAGTTVNPETYGVAGDAFLLFGYGWYGGIMYARLATSALTTTQIAAETAYWKGLAGGKSAKTLLPATFTRSTTSLAERVTGANGIVTIDSSWPTKMSEGGLLTQGDVVQLCQRTKEFSTSPWTTIPPSSDAAALSLPMSRGWQDVASSSSGQYLVACAMYGYVYTSSDYGVTWVKRSSAGCNMWRRVGCNSTGQYMWASWSNGSTYAYGYRSSDYGVTWSTAGSGTSLYFNNSTASDSTGQYVIAAASPTGSTSIGRSTDYGATFSFKTVASGVWCGATSSSNGAKLAMCAGLTATGTIITSIDSGTNWLTKAGAGTRKWTSIAGDTTGDKLAACVYGGYIYTSINGGDDWVERASSKYWQDIASNSDGTKLIACEDGNSTGSGQIYISSDSGATWTACTSAGIDNWNSVASDSTGQYLVACAGGVWANSQSGYGHIFRSSDYGSTWVQVTEPDNMLFYGEGTTNYTNIAINGNVIFKGAAGVYYYSALSLDAGTTWTIGNYNFYGFAGGLNTNADASFIAVISPGASSTAIPKGSTDRGVTWNSSSSGSWAPAIAMSSTGSYVYCAAASGYIYRSTTYLSGALTQLTNSGSRTWYYIDCSATGQYVCAIANTSVFYSSNYGIDWNAATGSLSSDSFSTLHCNEAGNIWLKGSGFDNGNKPRRSTDYGATWTECTDLPTTTGVFSCNAAGTKWVAIGNGIYMSGVWRSTNSGANWTQLTNAGKDLWLAVYVDSAVGDTITVIAKSGRKIVSTDGGATWTHPGFLVNCDTTNMMKYCGALDADGTNIVVAGSNGNHGCLYTSSDGGSTWVERRSAGPRNWSTTLNRKVVATDATGTRLVVCEYNSYIYTSADSGATWTQQTASGQRLWYGICSSNDGTYITACVYSGNLYTSWDSGATWVSRDSSRSWRGVACDSTGQYQIACVSSGYVYTSTNYGETWTQRDPASGTKSWVDVASDSTGQKLVACIADGSIYISTNGGSSWSAKANSGSANMIVSSSNGSIFKIAGSNSHYYANNGYIRGSLDSGVSWTTDSAFNFNDLMGYTFVAIDAGSNKGLVAADTSTASQTSKLYLVEFAGASELTCSPATIYSPDGTTSSFSLISSVASTTHVVIQQITLTADYYTFEVDVTTGDKNWVLIRNKTVSDAYAYFNTNTGVVGTVGAGCTASIYNRSGRRRCAIHFLGTAATHVFQISPASSNGSPSFAGDGSTPNVYVWEASCHLGKFQALPVTRSSTAVTRYADNLTYPIAFFPGYFLGNSYHNKSLTIELRVKCQYTDTNDIGVNIYRPFITIGGNTGTAGQTRNHVSIRAYNQYVYASFYSNDSTTHRYMSHTVADANKWHVYRVKFDFSNLTLSTFTKDGIPYTGSSDLSSSHNLDVTNCLLRVGQDYAGTVSGFCEIDYVKIWVGN